MGYALPVFPFSLRQQFLAFNLARQMNGLVIFQYKPKMYASNIAETSYFIQLIEKINWYEMLAFNSADYK